MFRNRYFDATNREFMYANMAIQNINFAPIYLGYIFEHSDCCESLYYDENTFYFFHIQSLLTACGNLSTIFYNNDKSKKIRCENLRNILSISDKDFPLVFKKAIRNTNEHADERYEELEKLGDYNLIDENTDDSARKDIKTNLHSRTYNKTTYKYYTYVYDKKTKKHVQIEYDLIKLRCELEEMLDRIHTSSLATNGWIDHVPSDNVT